MASFPHTAMILGAGFGQRARPLSLVRPKPLFPVLNRPIISHTLDSLAPLGLRQVVVNTHHLADRLEAYLAGLGHKPAIRISREETILGTGGGLRKARPFLGPDPFLVINGDIVTGVDLAALIAEHQARGPLATLVLHDCPKFNQVAVDEAGFIRGFRGKWPGGPENPGWRIMAFTGVHLVDPWVLTRLPDGPGDIIAAYQALIEAGEPVRAMVADDLFWWDAGTLESYLDLHATLLADRAAGTVLTESGWEAAPGARVEGWAALGQGVVLEEGAVVRNSVLWPGARVKAGVTVIDSVLADGAVAEVDTAGAALVPDERPGQA